MSVSMEGGRGRRAQGVELNLVPFVDFLSCLIAFLMMSAVVVEVEALDSFQARGDGVAEGPPPLTLHLSAAGAWVARDAAEGVRFAATAAGPDWVGVRGALERDRQQFPGADFVVLNVDDGVDYGAAAHAMDLAAEFGYSSPLLAGGPAAP